HNIAPGLIPEFSLALGFAPSRIVKIQLAPTVYFLVRSPPGLVRDDEIAAATAGLHLKHNQHARNIAADVMSANGNNISPLLNMARHIFISRLAAVLWMRHFLAIDVNGSFIIRCRAQQDFRKLAFRLERFAEKTNFVRLDGLSMV